MEEDDSLVEDDLRSKPQWDQEQKQRNQEIQHGGFQKSGMQLDSQDWTRDRFESKDFGGSRKGNFSQGRGW